MWRRLSVHVCVCVFFALLFRYCYCVEWIIPLIKKRLLFSVFPVPRMCDFALSLTQPGVWLLLCSIGWIYPIDIRRRRNVGSGRNAFHFFKTIVTYDFFIYTYENALPTASLNFYFTCAPHFCWMRAALSAPPQTHHWWRSGCVYVKHRVITMNANWCQSKAKKKTTNKPLYTLIAEYCKGMKVRHKL